MLFLLLEFGNNTYAVAEYGSAFHWPEHYVLVQGTEGAIRIDMCNVGMTVKLADGTEEQYLVHENEDEDEQRRQIYHSTEFIPLLNGKAARAAIATADAATLSLRENRKVFIAEVIR